MWFVWYRMDLDVCAGGNSTKGKAGSAHAGEGGAMAIVPLELYDSARAKIDANLRWLLAKAYGIGMCFLLGRCSQSFVF